MMNATPGTIAIYKDGRGFLGTTNQKIEKAIVSFENKDEKIVDVYVENTSILELSNYGFKNDLLEVTIHKSPEYIAQHEKTDASKFEGKEKGIVAILKSKDWKDLGSLSLKKFFKKAKPVEEKKEVVPDKKETSKVKTTHKKKQKEENKK